VIDAPAATAWYVYGVTEADPAPAAIDSTELVVDGRLAAIVGRVPLEEFDQEHLPERLNDRAWLERKARLHEDVLQAAASAAPVVPLRCGAIYRDRDDVRGLLESRRPELEAALDRVRGRVELGVKAWVDRAALSRTLGGKAAADQPQAGSGRAYLQRRSGEQRLAADVTARCAELAEEAHRRLSALAVDSVANRPQPRELTGRDETMLLNGAYLVDGDGARLRHEVERLADEHAALAVEYEITGPWPPHNFVELEAER
jgi:hypothetical protein